MKNSQISLTPYLHFQGNCEEAIKTYESVLGGIIEGINRFENGPMEVPESRRREEFKKIFCSEDLINYHLFHWQLVIWFFLQPPLAPPLKGGELFLWYLDIGETILGSNLGPVGRPVWCPLDDKLRKLMS